ncbi:patatin-like phospholipase family protein [Prauserella oleivorans]|uniref:Patatin-like phospholipase family protein n=1 Tax=Prauserella oleivorans TaxID=1478153 RepID=A0ABW5WAX8_9PSEU
MSAASSPSTAPSRVRALGLVAGALGLAVVGALLPWPAGAITRALAGSAQPVPLPAGTGTTAAWGLPAVACHGLALWLGGTAARWVACTVREARAARFARTAAVIAGVAGFLGNLLLLLATRARGTAVWALEATSALAVLACAAALPAAVLAGYGLAVLLWRCVVHTPERLAARQSGDVRTEPPRPLEVDDPVVPGGAAPDRTRWHNAYAVPDVDPGAVTERWRRGEHTTGICLSGGGIRAASVALGALQSLRTDLLDADYLVSVSGGGYTAGAFQQALTGASADGGASGNGQVVRDPRSVFTEGTAELHHIRRNSSYLADTPARMLGALGRIARGLVLSLTVLFGPAIVLGVLFGLFYDRVPITELEPGLSGVPVPRPGGLLALGAVTALAFLLALFARGNAPRRVRSARLAPSVTALAVVLAALVVVVPALVWAAGRLVSTMDAVRGFGPVGTVLLTYAAALASMFWKHRSRIGGQATGMFRRRSGGVPAALPSGVLQRLLVIVTTGILVVAWLLVFAGSAGTLGDPAALWTAAGVAVVVLVLGMGFDNTSLSLHPFYRRRLAAAFAVRRVRRSADGQLVAVPYDPAERTTLSAYGRVAGDVRFPQVIFAASANLTGENRTAPGLGSVSFTLGADWTGGPDVGWVRTRDLEEAVTPRFRRDLTVQGAVAISGAAFASSMGRSSRWFQVLLAVSGARLGAWLPNPAFVRHAREAADRGNWAHPWLPRARRLPYLVREVFGLHPHDERLLHVTDGGHYDNLGLVELFRRRCTRIYCVDVSNDTPPSASTLAQALTLARQELGVRVDLDEPWRADPGTAEPQDTGTPELTARLASSPLITGTIVYPPESGIAPEVRGRLVVARAQLWPELPYSLLSYAAHHPEFPNDSTGDQWFDDAKFSAYTELGRRTGAEARQAMGSPQVTVAPQKAAEDTGAAPVLPDTA